MTQIEDIGSELLREWMGDVGITEIEDQGTIGGPEADNLAYLFYAPELGRVLVNNATAYMEEHDATLFAEMLEGYGVEE